jgi:radical SAM protein with 4Fe4S-binding SPASM domain
MRTDLWHTLTWRRVLNWFLLRSSFLISKLTKRVVHAGYPMHFSFEPTTTCNLSCPECPSGLRMFSRPSGDADLSQFESWLNQFAPHAFWVNFYFQGEPFIHPRILDMFAMASSKKLFVSTSTNGHFLSRFNTEEIVKSGLNRLIVSVDGATQESFEKYRIGGKLHVVKEGVRRLLESRAKLGSKFPEVILQCLVLSSNEREAEDIRAMGKELGVDRVVFKTAQFYQYEQGHEFMPSNLEHSRYRKNPDGTYRVHRSSDDGCWRMWSGCVLTWDGRIVPCCFDKDASHEIGSIAQASLKSIWKSDSMRHFRAAVLNDRSQIDICANCSEGTKVWVES